MYIPKLKKPQKIKHLLIFDSESLLIEQEDKIYTKHTPYLICSSFLNRSQTRPTWKNKDFYCKDYQDPSNKFWNYVEALNNKYTNLNLVAHNAKYDTQVLRCIPILIAKGYEVESVSFANPFFIFLKHPDNNNKLSIWSSTNLFQTSLSQLGKIINLKKLDFDYYDKTPPIKKAITYCRRDVEILRITLQNYFNSLQILNSSTEKITVASQSFAIYRQNYMKENSIDLHKIKKVSKQEREAYHGGRTECFNFGEFKDIYITDINSMYPYIMKNFKVPCKKIRERAFLTVRQLKEDINDYYCISKVYIENCPEPVFSKVIDNKLCFITGSFWTTLTKPEILYALEKGYIKYITDTVFYEEDYIFSEYIDYFYNERLKCKDTDPNHAYFLKIFMNSLYGKFGQSDIKLVERGEVADKEKIDEFFEVVKNDDGSTTRKKIIVFGGKEWEQVNNGDSFYAFPAIAGAITSYARMLLWEYMNTAGRENVLYCDTDSLFTYKAGYDNLLNAGLINNDTIGMLKLENICTKINIRNVKDYEYTTTKDEVKNKKKGINLKQSTEIEPNKFEITYWSGYANLIHNKNMNDYYTMKRIKNYSNNYSKANVVDKKAVHFELNESEVMEKCKQ